MYKAIDIAHYLIARANAEGRTISNLKLQKLLYYTQGFFLVLMDKPLFQENIVKWSHGPVVAEMYHAFKSFKSNPIKFDIDIDDLAIDEEDAELIDEVYEVYGKHSAWSLRNLTHEEKPWIVTPDCGVISHDVMKDYFETLID